MTDLALLDQLHELTGLPLCLCSGDGEALHFCPRFPRLPLARDYLSYCVLDFSLQKRDRDHPLILVFEPGYFLGVARLEEDAYLLLGPAGPLSPCDPADALGQPGSQTLPPLGVHPGRQPLCPACGLGLAPLGLMSRAPL